MASCRQDIMSVLSFSYYFYLHNVSAKAFHPKLETVTLCKNLIRCNYFQQLGYVCIVTLKTM